MTELSAPSIISGIFPAKKANMNRTLNIHRRLSSHVMKYKFQIKPDLNRRLSVRYISTNDQDKPNRDKYIHSIFDTVSQRTFADDETFLLSRASADYDVLLIGGSDPVRMGRFIRANRALLNGIALIAVVTGSTPARRARLLNVGFDDVLDIVRTPESEARARINAIVNNYASARHAHSTAEQMASALEPICNPNNLAPREFALLWIMAENQGKAIPVAQMARQLDHHDPAQFRRSIKVTMSNLRRKLLPDWSIRSDLHGGYGLYRSDPDT